LSWKREELMPHHIRFTFPFSAIVGQEKMKKALLLNAVNPRIGGVLIRGQKGTGKSTAVRALADLLPKIKVVEECPFNCNPENPLEMCDSCYSRYERGEELKWVERKVKIVNLPLNATVDRVAGTLNIERALKEGIKALEPGLLAEANRGILYVDEVNLLDDYVADVLLDAAASGVNVVERENVSVSHPSRFILIGTMNPEEGELRPQLLDRFGLQVEVDTITDPALQVEIVKRVEGFEADPEGFITKYRDAQNELKARIERAQRLLSSIEVPEELLYEIANICAKLAVSNRAPIVITRAAKTIAALSGRNLVNRNDVLEAMEFALPHRMRKKPFERSLTPQELEELLSKELYDKQGAGGDQASGGRRAANPQLKEKLFDVAPPISIDLQAKEPRKAFTEGSGRTVSTKSAGSEIGVYVYSTIPRGKPKDVAIDATIRAATARAAGSCQLPLSVHDEDLREKVRRFKTSSLITLVVDASGSMAAGKRMEAAKGAVLGLLADAYKRRDKVAFIAFRGESAEVLLPPTSNVELAEEALKKLPTGGRTPLSHALFTALNVIKAEKVKRDLKPLVVLITDGKANVSMGGEIRREIVDLCRELKEVGSQVTVIDVSEDPFTPNYIGDIVEAAEARHVKMEKLTSVNLQEVIKRNAVKTS